MFLISRLGRWFYTKNGKKSKPFQQTLATKQAVVESDQFSFCFVPAADVFGEVRMTITPVFIVDKKANILGTQEVTIIVKINATNDNPIVVSPKLSIPALPYNMSDHVTTGYLVSDLLKKKVRGQTKKVVDDKDGDTLGNYFIQPIQRRL